MCGNLECRRGVGWALGTGSLQCVVGVDCVTEVFSMREVYVLV